MSMTMDVLSLKCPVAFALFELDPFREAVIVNRAGVPAGLGELEGVQAELRRLMQARRAQPRVI